MIHKKANIFSLRSTSHFLFKIHQRATQWFSKENQTLLMRMGTSTVAMNQDECVILDVFEGRLLKQVISFPICASDFLDLALNRKLLRE